MRRNKLFATNVRKIGIGAEIFKEYIAGEIAMHKALKITNDSIECGDPIQDSFNAGRLYERRMILIKYYGYTEKYLQDRIKWELEHTEG